MWTSRLAVWVAGVMGLLWFGRAPDTHPFDPAGLTTPFSPLANLLLAPAARWDSVWYLAIARDGYPDPTDHAKAAFFPLYPLLMRVLGWVVGSPLLAGLLLSLACFLGALVLLERLVALELGPERARATVMLMAFFPTALFFSAVYSESLFLLLSVGTLLAARRGRWMWAGVLGALAAATRNSGVLLIVPVALLFLYGPREDREAPPSRPGAGRLGRLRPRHPLTPSLLWAALIPCGLGAYLLYCAIALGDALAPLHAQALWFRHFSLLGGATGGVRSAAEALRDLSHGPPTLGPVQDLLLFGFLVFACIALVGALRRLPLAYGAYALLALVMILSSPVSGAPLTSLPRYIAVLFPLHMWLADRGVEHGRVERMVGVSAVLLGLMTAQFARWGFVA